MAVEDALVRAAAADPELAARMLVAALPAATAATGEKVAYDVTFKGIGRWRIAAAEGRAQVAKLEGPQGPTALAANGDDGGGAARPAAEFEVVTDPETLARLAAGDGPLKAVISRRLRIKGSRKRARILRELGPADPAAMAEAGVRVAPDLVYRMAPYLIDPAWTRGERFVIAYEVLGEGGGVWYLRVDDGAPVAVATEAPEELPDAVVTTTRETFDRIYLRQLTPAVAAFRREVEIQGDRHRVSQFGRWLDRGAGQTGEDDREREQREILDRRGPTWGAGSAGAQRISAAGADGLLDYQELYAQWEQQNWRAHELDFSRDREQWLTMPEDSQAQFLYSTGAFYIGEERVTADLAPFLLAAPSGEIEMFLATQLVDEARHTVFFDRFYGEVTAIEADDLRTRMAQVQKRLGEPWRQTFDDGLREIARRIQREPGNLELFVQGVTTYHMVVEGFLAMTGQRFIIDELERSQLFPGLRAGFELVERDEHRHIAFGVRFLKDLVEEHPRYREVILDRVMELAPKAAYVLAPPYVDDPSDYWGPGAHSSQVYGYAYRALSRRLGLLGIELPPAAELMPGPIDDPQNPPVPPVARARASATRAG